MTPTRWKVNFPGVPPFLFQNKIQRSGGPRALDIAMKLSRLICLMLVLVVGCKTTVREVRWYPGPSLSTNEIALLKIPRSVFGMNLSVTKINGEPLLKNPEKVRNWVKEVQLLPGKYDLMVDFYTPTPNGIAHSLADIPVSFTADGGKVYQLRAASLEKSFGESMRLAVAGGVYGWTAWIVETGTGTVVGGKARETPLRWHEK
jgi:hypothetical protein